MEGSSTCAVAHRRKLTWPSVALNTLCCLCWAGLPQLGLLAAEARCQPASFFTSVF